MERLERQRNLTKVVTGQIRQLANTLGPGTRLPTFRQMMDDLGVSQVTVAAAIRQLAAEGVVETRPGKGIFVAFKSRAKPILLLCETGAFVGASPFWEMLLEAFVRLYRDRPDRLVTQFTEPNLEERSQIPVTKFLSPSMWLKLDARSFSGAIAVCVDNRLSEHIEKFGIPVIGFGCAAATMVNLSATQSCRVGLEELLRLGCQKISMYNAPSVRMDYLLDFVRSNRIRTQNIVPPERAFKLHEPQLGYRHRLFEHGASEAQRLFGPDSDPTKRPDAILSIDEKFTQGFLLGLTKLGVVVDRDLKICTHYNKGSWVLSQWLSELVLMEFDPVALAVTLVDAIEKLVQGDELTDGGWENSVRWDSPQGVRRAMDIVPVLRRPTTA